jgi:hypothetical protein
MGNECLTKALRRFAVPTGGDQVTELILTAPDIDEGSKET